MKLNVIAAAAVAAFLTASNILASSGPVFSETSELEVDYENNPQSAINYGTAPMPSTTFSNNPQSQSSYANTPQPRPTYATNPQYVTYLHNGVQNLTDSAGKYTYIIVVRLLDSSSVIKRFNNLTGSWESDIPIPKELQQSMYSYRIHFPKDMDNKQIDNKLLLFVLSDVLYGGNIYMFDLDKGEYDRVNDARLMFDYSFTNISIIRGRIFLTCNTGGAGNHTYIIDYRRFLAGQTKK